MTGSKLVHGVGLNDASYVTHRYEQVDGKQKLVWACPIYQTWKRMLKRAYCKAYHAERTSYEGVSVCREWLTFSNFAAWMMQRTWEGKQLDKDILVPGNKEYGPDMCAFVSSRINSLLTNCSTQKGESLIGVYWRAHERKFVARSRSFGKSVWLGRFDTELEAHAAWQAFKADEIEREALGLDDQRIAQSLLARSHLLRSHRASGLPTTQL